MKKNKNKGINGGDSFSKRSPVQVRIIIMMAGFALLMLVFAFRLMVLQVSKNDYYSSLAVNKNYRNEIIRTSRGEIYDRNGVVLASNVKVRNVIINSAKLSTSDPNSTLLKFIDVCNEHGIDIPDTLPVTDTYPYVLDNDYIFDTSSENKLNKFLKNNSLTLEDVYEKGLYNILCENYGISQEDAKKNEYRKLLGMRYDMEVNDFYYTTYYQILSDIDEKTATVIAENAHLMHGIEISYSDKRYYNMDSLAAHMLGRVGRISPDETSEYVDEKGYSYDAVIGKDGVEKAFEEYLHGEDGMARLEIDSNNNVISKEVSKAPKHGNSVRLTVDAKLQEVSEKALETQVNAARKYGESTPRKHDGEDCRAGSVVVMDPNNAQILALANYPSYDLNKFSEIFDELRDDTVSRPLINRSTMGIYPPGSTFKIATAAAALGSGTIDSSTIVYDKGVYEKYDTYQPHCWIYDSRGETHGYVNVKSAIQGSCNYFFYDIADKMGIDVITEYASKFGLGKTTGVEIPEAKGILAGPEYRDSIGLYWNPGDTLQAAIGQSDNAFTPIQLCSYMSTVLNGGTRYKATLLKSVDDCDTGEAVSVNEPVVLGKVEMDDETLRVLKSAMRQVVVEGTAKNVFDNYPFEIGGKTGTAQVSGGSDTALFVGFAPYDNPQIVVAVVVENAHQSSHASNVAKEVFDYYFESIGMGQTEENSTEQ